MQRSFHRVTKRKGSSLIQLAAVTVIIGLVAAAGMPRFVKSVEKARAAEAFGYLETVRSAQERRQSRTGAYAGSLSDLDVSRAPLRYFHVGAVEAGSTGTLATSWTQTLTRIDASGRRPSYTVVFTDQGFDQAASTIEGSLKPTPRKR
jgi:type II secretory pathway pseudopilin PulG